MHKLYRVLLFVALFSACAQTPPENVPFDDQTSGLTPVRASSRRIYQYRVEASAQVVGFNIIVNGAELLVNNGNSNFSSQININDWMVPGNNRIDITIFWPEGVKFASGTASASFKLFSNNALIKEFQRPVSLTDTQASYHHTYTETFKADGFPRVQLDRAERIISSAGALPRDDQAEIAAIAEQLRRAFTERDAETIANLLRVKYVDLAAARFTTPAAVKAEADEIYGEFMEKESYTVAFNGRNSFFSAADDRVVKLGQGRIGFPEPALVITWREGRTTRRWVMDLYFAKIDGKWVIIR